MRFKIWLRIDYLTLYQENPKESTEEIVKLNVFAPKSVSYKEDAYLTLKGL